VNFGRNLLVVQLTVGNGHVVSVLIQTGAISCHSVDIWSTVHSWKVRGCRIIIGWSLLSKDCPGTLLTNVLNSLCHCFYL